MKKLRLITISGATATGKTTLVEALAQALRKRGPVYVVPSMSQELFRRVQEGTAFVDCDEKPKVYDDIDRLGIRLPWQMCLPSVLVDLLQAAGAELPGGGAVLVDRWFPDIHTYTMMGLSRQQEREGLLAVAGAGHSMALRSLAKFDVVRRHWLIPRNTCTFGRGGDQDGKFRGTSDADEWEAVLKHCWHDVVDCKEPQDRLLSLTTTLLADRVEEILGP